MTNTLFILNDPPYGTERTYNGLRLAGTMAKRKEEDVRIFLMGDAVISAKRGQRAPQGYYVIENMLRPVARHGNAIGVCGSCLDARGIAAEELIEGSHYSNMEELTDWKQWADDVLVF